MGYAKYLNQIWGVAIFGCALNHKLSMPMPLQCCLWTLENPKHNWGTWGRTTG